MKTLTLVNECCEDVVHVSEDTSIPVLYVTRVLMKPWRKKVLWRVYSELRLNLPRRARSGCMPASNNPCTRQATLTRG